MKTKSSAGESANSLVVTVAVVATILTLLGAAVGYTEHVSRMAQRSRKTGVAMEIADGHLEYLFSSWRNIYRGTWTTTSANSGGTDYSLVGTNYFYTTSYHPNPTPSPVPYMSPSATPPQIPLPGSSNFPTESNYSVTQYRIQAVDPMITVDANENAMVEVHFGQGDYVAMSQAATPPAAYGQNQWQYSFFYLAAVDVSVPAMTGSVTAKVRRVFEKKFDNPWTYAMFYNDDLELQPSTALTINGPIQTNGSLYIGTNNVTVQSKVGYGDSYVNGYSPNDTVHSGSVTAPNFVADQPPSQESPFLPFGWVLNLNNADGSVNNDSYHEIIEQPAGGTDPLANIRLYNQAGIKVLIDSNNNMTVYNAAGNVVTNASSGNDKAISQLIISAITKNTAFQDNREATYVRVADVDVSVLTTAINAGTISGFNGVIYIADTTTNGNNVTSKLGGTTNNVQTTERGIRLINGASLPSGNSSKSNAAGLTVVSANPVYIKGNYNTGGSNPPSNSGTYTDPDVTGYTRKYAAVIGDSINVLSSVWSDVNSPNGISSRVAANTTINAALVGGIVPTGNNKYSGGGENFIRFLEDWSAKTFCYYGSMVELFTSNQGTGYWTGNTTTYKAPLTSKFFWDTNFSNGAPPGNMQIAAYLQQQRWYQVY
jgi:hypothetical protein